MNNKLLNYLINYQEYKITNNCLFIKGEDLNKMKKIYGLTTLNIFELLNLDYLSIFWNSSLVEIYDSDYTLKKSFKKTWTGDWSFSKNSEPLTYKLQKLILIAKNYYIN